MVILDLGQELPFGSVAFGPVLNLDKRVKAPIFIMCSLREEILLRGPVVEPGFRVTHKLSGLAYAFFLHRHVMGRAFALGLPVGGT